MRVSTLASTWMNLSRHRRARDLPLVGLVLLSLLLIGLHLQTTLEEAERSASGGWRRIDRAALERRIDSGDLRDLRADWYHPTRPDEHPPTPGEETP